VALITSGYTPTTEQTPASFDCRPVKLWCGVDRFGKIWSALILPLRFPWYNTRARTCARSRCKHRCKRSNNAARSRIGIFHCSLTACFEPNGAQIFEKKSRKHLTILDSRKLTWNMFYTKYTQILGASVQNSVVLGTWRLKFVHHCFEHLTKPFLMQMG